ncbi:AIR carboxylase family protein, partial [Escherichia coli]|uniref:AIR carboxylase family protein n=1 Tax=Escherichia coli TaxID=562 RepID=UPI00098B7509
PHHVDVASAHRTPDQLFSFPDSAEENGSQLTTAAAPRPAHLPGMPAAKTLVPVLVVPITCAEPNGVANHNSTAPIPPSLPRVTLALGKATQSTAYIK